MSTPADSRPDDPVAALKQRVSEISVDEAAARQRQGAVLVDVREQDEIAQGSPAGAARPGRSFLELQIGQLASPEQPVLLICGSGKRSLFAAAALADLGYQDVHSVAGGLQAWKGAGLPLEMPALPDPRQRERYARHLLLPEIGEEGQERLLAAKVLICGAGGLGSPAALYLAAAGVGTLGLIDPDVVDRSNLQRQILHTDYRVGTPKVASGAETLRALNPDVTVHGYQERLSLENIDALLPEYDMVLDASDNFATRYLVNDASVKYGKPNVHGAIYRFEGQVSVFWPGHVAEGESEPGPCYRCLFPTPPPAELAPDCATAGVLGVLPGVLGTLQAVEVIKLIVGAGKPMISRMLYYDALATRFEEIAIRRNRGCRYCGDEVNGFPGYDDYVELCGSA